MKPLGFPLLADENIHPDVVQALADQGKDIRSVQSEGLAGRRDVVILRHALPRGWVVLTHRVAADRVVISVYRDRGT
jgi:predicted nuclease of predicted toxin-antitoxin system